MLDTPYAPRVKPLTWRTLPNTLDRAATLVELRWYDDDVYPEDATHLVAFGRSAPVHCVHRIATLLWDGRDDFRLITGATPHPSVLEVLGLDLELWQHDGDTRYQMSPNEREAAEAADRAAPFNAPLSAVSVCGAL